ncbi:MAG: iron-containing alcohol dehydrogenase [Clostridia bacterium]|nr:iron-containing alcohol dehydrogenase [Clostridia bacterium]
MPGAVFSGEQALLSLDDLGMAGENVCMITDHGVIKAGVADRVLSALKQAGAQVRVIDQVPPEPAYQDVQRLATAFAEGRFHSLVAVGGGSVMDTAKLCSIVADGGSVKELLQTPGKGKKVVRTVMVPTTAGTGAEATPNAIVAVPEEQVKVGIVNHQMIPDAVILDPEMIRGLPANIAAATGVDAMCHAVECYTSLAATPFSDLYALEAIRLIFSHLAAACLSPEAMESKAAMLLAAFYGGVAIQCSGTTAVHALSYPLGGKYHIPHGIANAVLLMPVMRFNLDACAERLACIYDALAMRGADAQIEKAQAVLDRMETLVKQIRIPSGLEAYGVKRDDLEDLVQAGMGVQRLLKNNRRTVTAADARMMYRQVLN